VVSTSWIRFFFWSYLLFLIGADATATNPADPDLWHRLALGEFLWKTGHFPLGDQFSYLADYQNIADHEWGSAVIFYAVWQMGGPSAMVAMKLITLAITMALLVWAGLRQRRPSILLAAFYALVLLALLPSFQSTLRCMSFTHVFFALWLYWFQCERRGRPIATVWYVVTMILWANLHGGFAIGLAWLLAVAVVLSLYGEPWRPWALRFGLCSVATILNPFGWELWISTGRALLSTRRGFEEWAPVSWLAKPMAYPGYKLMLLSFVVALIILIYRQGWKKIDRSVVFLIGIFLALSITSARQTSLFAAIVGALAPGLFPPAPKLESIENPIERLGYMGISAMLLLVPLYSIMIVLPGDGFVLRYDGASCPVAAVDYLKRQGIKGNLLVPFNYGSYAMWELRGQMRVSMDGRYDLVYRPATYDRVEDFFFARGDWQSLLTTPKPDAILLPREDAVYPKLWKEAGWKEAWHDSTDAVFLPQ
jgi:hypothetical protein